MTATTYFLFLWVAYISFWFIISYFYIPFIISNTDGYLDLQLPPSVLAIALAHSVPNQFDTPYDIVGLINADESFHLVF